MPRVPGVIVSLSAVLTVSACQAPGSDSASVVSEPAIDQASVAQDYRPAATIRELMQSVVDPSADVVWNSVAVMATKQGLTKIRPQSDEEWAAVRHAAVVLMESANLLMIPGRRVAHPGERSSSPPYELEPEEIDGLIAEDRNAWDARALVLQEVLSNVIGVIDDQDADQLYELGEQIEAVCESCHRQYWYPNDINPLLQDIP